MSIFTSKNGIWRDLQRASASRKTAYILAILAILSGATTVLTIVERPGQTSDINTVLSLLYIDGILFLLLGAVVARRLAQVWSDRRRGAAGSGLQVRLVVLFSLVAVTPAILVAVFSALFLHFGMQSWFAERVRTALNQSQVVAQAYLVDHRRIIEADAFALANELNVNASQLMRSRVLFENVLSSQSAFRSLTEAVVLDGSGNILARAHFSLTEKIENVSVQALNTASQGRIAVLDSENVDRMRALIKLNRFIDAYLLVERYVDPRVINHIESIRKAVNEYQTMEKERSGIQVSFIIIFLMVSLLLLLAAAWIGLTVSSQLADPISNLISATDEASQGNLGVRVEVGEDTDEISSLGRAFNNMTNELESQREGLVTANRELDERRRFTETVLAGVSAGIIGLDADGRIHLSNRSASDLLSRNLGAMVGAEINEAVPEMAELFDQMIAAPARTYQKEISLDSPSQHRTLLSRMAAEYLDGDIIGYVVTFDDVTDLLSAQRKAAWADVARRIAHEIKNPLTPIQLSAERLQRKYQDEVASDPDIFRACTDTIIRQVSDIGRMVDEFSSFARMPQPLMYDENIVEVCRESAFLERNRNVDLVFKIDLPDTPVMVNCDRRQIAQALTNLLKNAWESIEARLTNKSLSSEPGQITLRLINCISDMTSQGGSNGTVLITIEDNGVGLPLDKGRLTEPYVTTHKKGTGLGLAIVRKIMEDHHGRFVLDDRPDGGAKVSMIFENAEDRRETASTDTGHDPETQAGAS
jgi:two-component system, NtrC family, nitrogen regulation sensor histidine kinase NtrY